jgi:tetraacyldisaccharide 4'-kinase
VDLPQTEAHVWRVRRTVTLSPKGDRAVAFCGIARPGQFFEAMKGLGQEIAGKMIFRDHHRYLQADVDRLLRLKNESGAEGFVTTEKDLINLGPLSAQLQPLRTAELRLQLEAPDQALTFLFETIEQRTGCRV